MSLYTKRVSALQIEADGLYDQAGKPLDSIETKSLTIKAGDKTLVVKLSPDGVYLEVESFQKRQGYSSKNDPTFRMSL